MYEEPTPYLNGSVLSSEQPYSLKYRKDIICSNERRLIFCPIFVKEFSEKGGYFIHNKEQSLENKIGKCDCQKRYSERKEIVMTKAKSRTDIGLKEIPIENDQCEGKIKINIISLSAKLPSPLVTSNNSLVIDKKSEEINPNLTYKNSKCMSIAGTIVGILFMIFLVKYIDIIKF